MTIEQKLLERAQNACELCKSQGRDQADSLTAYAVEPNDDEIVICAICKQQVESGALDPAHWQILSETMWSDAAPVQAMIWRVLKALKSQSWASDLRDMLYLNDDIKAWADAQPIANESSAVHTIPTKDSNGTILTSGDTITLIKDLAVKGAGFTAKRGTLVRGISLTDNPLHIEGRVNGQQIVLVSAYLKKVV